VNYRVTHRCVKEGLRPFVFRPTWQKPRTTILESVTDLFLEFSGKQTESDIKQDESSNESFNDEPNLEENTSIDQLMEDFGPNLSDVRESQLPSDDQGRQASKILDAYIEADKGYLKNVGKKQKRHNYDLKLMYDENPRDNFWLDSEKTAGFDPTLIAFAKYIFTIISASASPERTFSIMKHMISSRRSSITGANTDRRLTVRSLLPMKRKLEELVESKRASKAKRMKKVKKKE